MKTRAKRVRQFSEFSPQLPFPPSSDIRLTKTTTNSAPFTCTAWDLVPNITNRGKLDEHVGSFAHQLNCQSGVQLCSVG